MANPKFRVPNFCAQCGQKMVHSDQEGTRWFCENGHKTYCNPIPVGVGIVSTSDGGYVLIRRAIEPAIGMLAFPGGNIGANESAVVAISREVEQETGLQTDPSLWLPNGFVSTPDHQKILLFAIYQEAIDPDVCWTTPDGEASEVVIVYHLPRDMAFPLHERVLYNLLHE